MYYIKFKRSIHFSLRGGSIHYYSHPLCNLTGKKHQYYCFRQLSGLKQIRFMMITTHLHDRNSFRVTNTKQQLGEKHHFRHLPLVELHTFRTPLTRNRYHFRRFCGIPFIFEGCRGEACRLGVFWVCGEQVSWILVIHKYTLQGTIIWDSPNGKSNIIDWKCRLVGDVWSFPGWYITCYYITAISWNQSGMICAQAALTELKQKHAIGPSVLHFQSQGSIGPVELFHTCTRIRDHFLMKCWI